MVIGTGRVATSALAVITRLRLFAAFRHVGAAFSFLFLGVFFITGQRAAARYVPLRRGDKSAIPLLAPFHTM